MKTFSDLFFSLIVQIFIASLFTKCTRAAECRIDFYIKNNLISIPQQNLSPEDFLNHACSVCYANLPPAAFKEKQHAFRYDNATGLLLDANNITYESGKLYKNSNSPIHQTFQKDTVSFWEKCCAAAENCCNSIQQQQPDVFQCPPVWDGLQCWLNAEKVTQDCPEFYPVYIIDKPSHCKRHIQRRCNGLGQWYDKVDHCNPFEYYRYYKNISGPNEDKCCRAQRGHELSYEAFQLHSCGNCYYHSAHKEKLNYSIDAGALYNESSGEIYYADLEGNTTFIEFTFGSKKLIEYWKSCCRSAMVCCDLMLKRQPPPDAQDYCPQTWDGWTCYDYTAPQTVVYQACPAYTYVDGAQPRCLRHSEKRCENGTWAGRLEQTEYKTCGYPKEHGEDQAYLMAWHSVSLVFLVVALLPFFLYRQLHVQRITIHKNLFIALAMNSFFSILLIRTVLLEAIYNQNEVLKEDGPGCRMLSILLRYSVLAGQCWMLCEGLYLHQVITAAFKEQKSLKLFYLIGWGIPAVIISIYAILLKTLNYTSCWAIVGGNIVWLTSAPGTLCLLLNLVLLVNVIRVLVTKLRSVQTNEPLYFRKAVRAMACLIPLLGLHQFITAYQHDFSQSTCSAMYSYHIFQFTVLGLEGVVVSLLFCYLNGEVLYLIKRSIQKFRASHTLPDLGSRFSFSTQVSTVAPDNKRVAETRY